MLPQGAWKISGNGIGLLYEPTFHWITRTTYEGNRIVEKNTCQYVLNDQGIFVPQIETTEILVTRPSGACMEQVIRKQYSTYRVALANSGRSSYNQGPIDKSSLLVPNPAAIVVTLRLGPTVRPDSRLQVTDLLGKIVFEEVSVQPSSEQSLSVMSWPPGVYLFLLQTETGTQILKFIKENQ